MSCATCNGYYACWCHADKMAEEIRIKRLEIDSLTLKRMKFYEQVNKHEHEGHRRVYKEV